jgi:hypothetical protein
MSASNRTRLGRHGASLVAWAALVIVLPSGSRGATPLLSVPGCDQVLHIAVPLSEKIPEGAPRSWRLVEAGDRGASVPAALVPQVRPDGTIAETSWCLVASIPPGPAPDGRARRFRLEAVASTQSDRAFRFAPVDDRSLGLWEGARPVLVYRHGIQRKPGVPADRARSTYIHPLYGLDGEVLSDDFPVDHYHHRGLFWAWPHVGVGGKDLDLWMLHGIEQRFERWLTRQDGDTVAVLGVENGWYVGPQKVMQERIWLRVYPASDEAQAVDLVGCWEPTRGPITLGGAEGKSYGGLTLRFAPRTDTVITTPRGNGADDLAMVRLPWADLTGRFAGASRPSGAAIVIAPEHPDFPPMWLTRHYGALCVGWPGVEPGTLEPGRPVSCRYRVWVHRGQANARKLEDVSRTMRLESSADWEDPSKRSDRARP